MGPDGDEATGLAHVATVSFLGARAAPSGQFWVALAGGVALARAAARRGLRTGYAASAGAMLQTVAVMGPARVSGPLTQAMTAPLVGRMEARGRPAWAQMLACGVIRYAHYTLLTAALIWIVLGGLDAYAGSYDALTGWLGVLPRGATAALVLTALSNLVWTVAFSVIQVLVYRRALRRWPDAPGVRHGDGDGEERGPGRFDPRAIGLAAGLATALLLTGTSWPLLAGVGAWLAAAWALSRPDREAVPLGAALALTLAVSALAGSLLAGLGLDEALRRALRAALLVAVATWLRAAAGPAGLREVFRRLLGRMRRLPLARQTGETLERLDHGPRLIAAGRSLASQLEPVRKAPLPIADAVIGWVAGESAGFRGEAGTPRPRLRLRGGDRALVLMALVPAVALLSPG
jgi:hypothetical protein